MFGEERMVEPLNPYCVVYDGVLRDVKSIDCSDEARKRMNSFLALAYWRAVRGSEFPSAKEIADEEGE